jgi:hypothetical protein
MLRLTDRIESPIVLLSTVISGRVRASAAPP